ncbi:phospho-sugar mutase [Paractinoplanes brasiliensis]|uniref:Phosphomannomutase n=1 Tax=Paractinoplanes brasiliensis TaxID=52695 RepID=A0A4R6JY71_9ACTN|nr:phospho-sugar mutase [Actinoplanes brasiliensis]TDO40206.1 phosphomannomutase [Actinoplanes brasiliensis]GID25272.1 phosphomannomutase [Actinoplanes brasiliensis]
MAPDELQSLAETWLADDPDPATRDELTRLIAGLPGTEAELRDRFAGPLTFGTAGLRGRLRAGPNGMNLAVVTRAAAGLITWLAEQGGAGPLVIGYDARHGSKEFAEQTARVATGAGRDALVMPALLPTPVLAYAVRALDAVAGVMVTASHNPPQDNGYKVYLGRQLGGPGGDGAQIVPPADAGIEAAIRAVGRIADIPLGPPGTLLDDKILERYAGSAAAVLSEGGPRDIVVAYTPMHGVGASTLLASFAAAGFPDPAVVAAQAEPDPEFPTVAFPNPEEPGAMDLLLELAATSGADLAIANDPDADRCAVAVPAGDGWRALRGDELGVLLGDHLIRRGRPGTYATTIVSSQLLGRLCQARRVPYAETLTGFKWIVRAAEELAYGYEEALGYCVAPGLVRDKDGITAALTVAELAAGLKAEGRTLADRLDELATEFGVHATDQLSVRVDDLAEIGAAMTRARQAPPGSLLGEAASVTDDTANNVLTFRTASARAVIRPSGTEPKLKAYLEVVVPVDAGGPAAARARAGDGLVELRREIATALGV